MEPEVEIHVQRVVKSNVIKIDLLSKKEKRKKSPYLLCSKKWPKEAPLPLRLRFWDSGRSFLYLPRPDTEPPCSHSSSHKLLAELLATIDKSGQNTHLLAHLTPILWFMCLVLMKEKPLKPWSSPEYPPHCRPYPSLNLVLYFLHIRNWILANKLYPWYIRYYNSAGSPSYHLPNLLPKHDNEERPLVDRARSREHPALSSSFVGVFPPHNCFRHNFLAFITSLPWLL